MGKRRKRLYFHGYGGMKRKQMVERVQLGRGVVVFDLCLKGSKANRILLVNRIAPEGFGGLSIACGMIRMAARAVKFEREFS